MVRSSLAAIILLALVARSLGDTASVEVLLPDDDNFTKYSFAYLTISGLNLIDSASSALEPGKFDVDKSSEPNRIVFKPNLTNGAHTVQVTAGGASHQLTLTVSRLPVDVIDNAVFVAGPTSGVSSLVATLRSKSMGRLVSQLQSGADTTEAAVLIPKTGTTTYLPQWEAYELVNNEEKGGVQVMPDRCPDASPQLCRSRLTFSSSLPSVHPAVVQLNSNTNFLGFGLSWVAQTAEQMSAEPCRPATCLNGGVCDANFTGTGYRCICPTASNILWGPRCEYPIRSYTQNESPAESNLAYTRHWVGGLPHTTESLQISFEISGTVTKDSHVTFNLTSSNSSTPLLSASVVYKQAAIRVTGRLLNGTNIHIDIAQLNTGSWFAVYILIKPSLSRVVICPKKLVTNQGVQPPYDCFSQSVTAGSTIKDFTNFWLDIGRGLKGCVQSVRVNGYPLDMAAGRIHWTGQANVGTLCDEQNAACRYSNASNPFVCGERSVCYGILSSISTTPMDCDCRCIGSKRKVLETVKTSGLCRKNISTSNECIKDPLIISTASASMNEWKLNSRDPVPLEEKNAASIELELRTRANASDGVLNAVIMNDARSIVMNQRLNIADGRLQLCIGAPGCIPFPPVRVDDGEWHSVFAATSVDLLILIVDGVSTMYDISLTAADFAKMELTAKIANSWLRNVRVSETYMSTTANETDRTSDIPSGNYVSPSLANDAIVGTDGVDPAPPCNCISTERCVKLWGKTTCECPVGQERDASNNCAAVNPCSKFNIRCPSGASCQATGVDPGFECVCPPGVASRMCSAGSESTAAVQWWIWLIVAIVAFLVFLLFLILLLLLGFFKRSQQQGRAGATQGDIEKINQDMGDDSGNDGVPPEDYNGPLSLHFPVAQKDNNDGLPNFQPVQAAPLAGSPVETQHPLGAPVAPDSTAQEPPDAAAGDETLNYGYEDTRDDDAADLDQVSLVSSDTDCSIDLRPTLDAWGPKFQSLSDILT